VITWDPDPVLLHGPTPLRYYGLVFAVTTVAAFFLWRWQMRRAGHSDEVLAPFLAYGLVGVVVGARLAHCLFYDWERCVAQPWFVFAVWLGGLSSHGATAGLIAALVLYARRYRLPLSDAADRLSFGAALGATTVRLANFLNSEIVGRPTDGSWGVRFPRHDQGLPLDRVPLRHPSQLYEAALGLVLLGVLLLVDRRLGEKRPRGLLSALFLVLYFSGRFVLEYFKAYQTLDPGRWPLTMGQLLSLPPLALGLVWLALLARHGARA
jgi:phosphatidylglycerol:prolipoprotein diacylglycerol transferase